MDTVSKTPDPVASLPNAAKVQKAVEKDPAGQHFKEEVAPTKVASTESKPILGNFPANNMKVEWTGPSKTNGFTFIVDGSKTLFIFEGDLRIKNIQLFFTRFRSALRQYMSLKAKGKSSHAKANSGSGANSGTGTAKSGIQATTGTVDKPVEKPGTSKVIVESGKASTGDKAGKA